jgi:hypothetical protein
VASERHAGQAQAQRRPDQQTLAIRPANSMWKGAKAGRAVPPSSAQALGFTLAEIEAGMPLLHDVATSAPLLRANLARELALPADCPVLAGTP